MRLCTPSMPAAMTTNFSGLEVSGTRKRIVCDKESFVNQPQNQGSRERVVKGDTLRCWGWHKEWWGIGGAP